VARRRGRGALTSAARAAPLARSPCQRWRSTILYPRAEPRSGTLPVNDEIVPCNDVREAGAEAGGDVRLLQRPLWVGMDADAPGQVLSALAAAMSAESKR